MEVKVTDTPVIELLSSTSFVFGLVFWGNLIDNAVNPKFILLICEASIAIAYLMLGYTVMTKVTSCKPVCLDETLQELIYLEERCDVLTYIFSSGIVIVSAI